VHFTFTAGPSHRALVATWYNTFDVRLIERQSLPRVHARDASSSGENAQRFSAANVRFDTTRHTVKSPEAAVVVFPGNCPRSGQDIVPRMHKVRECQSKRPKPPLWLAAERPFTYTFVYNSSAVE